MSCCSRLETDLWNETKDCAFCGDKLNPYTFHRRIYTKEDYCSCCWSSFIRDVKCAKCKKSLKKYRAEDLIQFNVGDEDPIFNCEDCWDPDA